MIINWSLITTLCCLSIPGVIIVCKRLVDFLLPDTSEISKKRIYRWVLIQTFIMVIVLSFAGAVLSQSTHLNAPILEGLLQGTFGMNSLATIIVPAAFYAFVGLLFFLILYYGVVAHIIEIKSIEIMNNLRKALGVDGCILYGGVVEEVIARWGLMNMTAFFALIFTKEHQAQVIWLTIFISGLLYAVSQVPAYIAAGCKASRRFIYCFLLLSLYQSFLFGYLFWQYGLTTAILSHMLFHFGWATYDSVKNS